MKIPTIPPAYDMEYSKEAGHYVLKDKSLDKDELREQWSDYLNDLNVEIVKWCKRNKFFEKLMSVETDMEITQAIGGVPLNLELKFNKLMDKVNKLKAELVGEGGSIELVDTGNWGHWMDKWENVALHIYPEANGPDGYCMATVYNRETKEVYPCDFSD